MLRMTHPNPSQSAVLIAHPDRSRSDMCPGALKLHHATDGSIGRVRFPGGRVRPEQWKTIAQIARELGDGTIHITTRGNMQFRGVKDEAQFATVVEKAGFLPSRSHDKIRNILASPLHPELRPLVESLDAALLNDDVVSGLSGRTLFGFDAGEGDILGQRPDFGVIALDDAHHMILGGQITEVRLNTLDIIPEVLTFAARMWQENREDSWRLHESPSIRAHILDQVQTHFSVDTQPVTPPVIEGSARPVGWIDLGDERVSLGAGLRFGFLTAQVADILSAIDAETTITPWASIVIHDLPHHDADAVVKVLAPLGLIFDQESPWLRVTACTGLPGCQKSLSNTQKDATQLVLSDKAPEGLVHFSGCDRRCGHPLSHHTEYVATGDGEYEVSAR